MPNDGGDLMSTNTQPTQKTFNRREFIKLSSLLGLGVTAGALIPRAESVAFNRRLQKVSLTRLGMGTFITITVMDPSRVKAEEAIERAFDEIDHVASLMDRYRTDSPVAILNQEGRINHVPPHVSYVVSRSLYYYKKTKGAFDITVKPLIDLYNRYIEDYRSLPGQKEVDRALKLVDGSAISLDNGAIHFKKEGMGITLDGIAKGYVVDRAIRIIQQNGIQHALVDAGGDIRATGGKEGSTPWKIGIRDPWETKSCLETVSVINGSVATSGNYEIFFDNEKLYHHIMNPRTGVSPRRSVSVSIIAPRALDADAISTAVFVLEPEEGMRFVSSLPDTECLIIDRNKKKTFSKAWPSAQWLNEKSNTLAS